MGDQIKGSSDGGSLNGVDRISLESNNRVMVGVAPHQFMLENELEPSVQAARMEQHDASDDFKQRVDGLENQTDSEQSHGKFDASKTKNGEVRG